MLRVNLWPQFILSFGLMNFTLAVYSVICEDMIKHSKYG